MWVSRTAKSAIEAEMAKQKLAALRQQQEQQGLDRLRTMHMSMKQELEQVHQAEFNAFNQEWDTLMQDYEAKTREDETAMIAKQQQEFEQITQTIMTKLPEHPKLRPEILNLKKMQLNLAKQKK
jgi:hypothetical protein